MEIYFDQFDQKISNVYIDSLALSRANMRIVECLRTYMGLIETFRTGSTLAGTAISPFSDVDLFVRIPRAYMNANSTKSLIEVYNALSEGNFINISLQSPVVVVKYVPGGDQYLDVVPSFSDDDQDQELLLIPGFDGDWIRSNPKSHGAVITKGDLKAGGRLKPLIRFLKAWKYGNNVPIVSFFLECAAYWYVQKQYVVEYGEAIENVLTNIFFGIIKHEEGYSITNPISSYLGDVQPFAEDNRGEVYQKMLVSIGFVKAANEMALEGEFANAAGVWNMAFGNGVQFP